MATTTSPSISVGVQDSDDSDTKKGSSSPNNSKVVFNLKAMRKAMKSIHKSLATSMGNCRSTDSESQPLLSAVDCEDDAILISKPSRAEYLIGKITETFDLDRTVVKEREDDILSVPDADYDKEGYELLAATEEEKLIMMDLMMHKNLCEYHLV